MYTIEQSYTKISRGWLPGSTRVIGPNGGCALSRSYDGAYYDNRAPRQIIRWKSDHLPTYEEILEHGPVGVISQDVIREEERKQVEWNERLIRVKELQAAQKRERYRYRGFLVLALVVGMLVFIAMFITASISPN